MLLKNCRLLHDAQNIQDKYLHPSRIESDLKELRKFLRNYLHVFYQSDIANFSIARRYLADKQLEKRAIL